MPLHLLQRCCDIDRSIQSHPGGGSLLASPLALSCIQISFLTQQQNKSLKGITNDTSSPSSSSLSKCPNVSCCSINTTTTTTTNLPQCCTSYNNVIRCRSQVDLLVIVYHTLNVFTLQKTYVSCKLKRLLAPSRGITRSTADDTDCTLSKYIQAKLSSAKPTARNALHRIEICARSALKGNKCVWTETRHTTQSPALVNVLKMRAS